MALAAKKPNWVLSIMLNGTGRDLLATADFLATQKCDNVIITMGYVLFVKKETYATLIKGLAEHSLMALGFRPEDENETMGIDDLFTLKKAHEFFSACLPTGSGETRKL